MEHRAHFAKIARIVVALRHLSHRGAVAGALPDRLEEEE
jgi:hypothetical protein